MNFVHRIARQAYTICGITLVETNWTFRSQEIPWKSIQKFAYFMKTLLSCTSRYLPEVANYVWLWIWLQVYIVIIWMLDAWSGLFSIYNIGVSLSVIFIWCGDDTILPLITSFGHHSSEQYISRPISSISCFFDCTAQ